MSSGSCVAGVIVHTRGGCVRSTVTSFCAPAGGVLDRYGCGPWLKPFGSAVAKSNRYSVLVPPLGIWLCETMTLGAKGALLVVALGVGVVWLLVEWGVLSPEGTPAITHIALAVISLLLGVGLSWSLISRRLTGQVDIDESN